MTPPLQPWEKKMSARLAALKARLGDGTVSLTDATIQEPQPQDVEVQLEAAVKLLVRDLDVSGDYGEFVSVLVKVN